MSIASAPDLRARPAAPSQSASPHSSGHSSSAMHTAAAPRRSPRAMSNASSSTSAEKKRARDRRAQQNMRKKRSSYLQDLEARITFSESTSRQQVQSLTWQLKAEKETNRKMRAKLEFLSALVRGWGEADDVDDANESGRNNESQLQLTAAPLMLGISPPERPHCTYNKSGHPHTPSPSLREIENAQRAPQFDTSSDEVMSPRNESWSPYFESFGIMELFSKDCQVAHSATKHHHTVENIHQRTRQRSDIHLLAEPEFHFQSHGTVASADKPCRFFRGLQEHQEASDMVHTKDIVLYESLDDEQQFLAGAPWQPSFAMDTPSNHSDYDITRSSAQSSLFSNTSNELTSEKIISIMSSPAQQIKRSQWALVPLACLKPVFYIPAYVRYLSMPEVIDACEEIPCPPDILFGSSQNLLANAIAADLNIRLCGLRLAEKLAIAYLAYMFCKWRASPSKERFERLPQFMHPTREQLTKPHPPTWDLFMFPQLRAGLIQMSSKYHCEQAMKELYQDVGESLELDWEDDIQVLVCKESKLVFHEKFIKTLTNPKSWTISREFQEKYPDLIGCVS